MEIKLFESEDAEGVQELILGIQVNEFGLPITRDDQPDLKDIEKYYMSCGGNFWVAKSKGAVVGTVALIKLNEGIYSLRKMFVNSSYRGRNIGLAHELLQTSERWAKSKGGIKIVLGTTVKFLAAHTFYARNGYSSIDQSRLPADFPVMAVDKLFFEKLL